MERCDSVLHMLHFSPLTEVEQHQAVGQCLDKEGTQELLPSMLQSDGETAPQVTRPARSHSLRPHLCLSCGWGRLPCVCAKR